jgi:hypothetical protein
MRRVPINENKEPTKTASLAPKVKSLLEMMIKQEITNQIKKTFAMGPFNSCATSTEKEFCSLEPVVEVDTPRSILPLYRMGFVEEEEIAPVFPEVDPSAIAKYLP